MGMVGILLPVEATSFFAEATAFEAALKLTCDILSSIESCGRANRHSMALRLRVGKCISTEHTGRSQVIFSVFAFLLKEFEGC